MGYADQIQFNLKFLDTVRPKYRRNMAFVATAAFNVRMSDDDWHIAKFPKFLAILPNLKVVPSESSAIFPGFLSEFKPDNHYEKGDKQQMVHVFLSHTVLVRKQ